MDIDRTSQPITQLLPSMEILPSETHILKNGIPLLILHNENQKIIRLDLRLRAGSSFQEKNAVALITSKTLFEGTQFHTRSEIYSALDFQGAYMDRSVDKDFANFSVYMPKEAVKEIFTIVKEVFTSPDFPEEELILCKEQQKQSLCVSMERTSVLAFRSFIQTVFSGHPYGTITHPNDFDCIERQDIINFYTSFYQASNIHLFIAGNIDDEVKNYLEETIGSIPMGKPIECKKFSFTPLSTDKILISKDEAMQSSICIGKKLFTRMHPDWMKLSVLNMILGGYFGSRLMSEIREKKALAYGISSRMVSYQESGIFYIAADVNKDKTEEAIDAVYKTLENLQKFPVLNNELNLVKNYYYGILLRNFDGIFSLLDRYIEINDYNISIEYWLTFLQVIKNIEIDEIQLLAQQYFDPNSMFEIVAGSKKEKDYLKK